MSHRDTHSSPFKRTALSVALCSGLLVGHTALAQERGQLSDQTPESPSAAAQTAQQDALQGQLGQPRQPVQPGQIGQPSQPGQIGQPVQPGQPGQIGQPGLPGQPAQPGQIGQPGQPGQPGLRPTDPALGGPQEGMQLGVAVESHEDGLRVVGVRDDSTAKKAGLKEGDIIKRFNDQEVRDAQSLQRHISQLEPGDEAKLVVQRDDEEKELTASFEQDADRYHAARPAQDSEMREELQSLRSQIQELRQELEALKRDRQNADTESREAAEPEQNDEDADQDDEADEDSDDDN